MVPGRSTAITPLTDAFGQGLLGPLRDATGGYTVPLRFCIAADLAAAAAVLVRGRC